jgi:hypothetical protein
MTRYSFLESLTEKVRLGFAFADSADVRNIPQTLPVMQKFCRERLRR